LDGSGKYEIHDGVSGKLVGFTASRPSHGSVGFTEAGSEGLGCPSLKEGSFVDGEYGVSAYEY
jgi:hypothetical protein